MDQQSAQLQRRLQAEALAQAQFDKGNLPSVHTMLAEQTVKYSNEKNINKMNEQLQAKKR